MSDCSRVTDTDTALFISNALLEMSNSQLLWVWTFRFFAQPVSYRQLRYMWLKRGTLHSFSKLDPFWIL